MGGRRHAVDDLDPRPLRHALTAGDDRRRLGQRLDQDARIALERHEIGRAADFQPRRHERARQLHGVRDGLADQPPVRDPQVDRLDPVGKRDGADVEATSDGSGAYG